jgi:ABC-type transport system involved in multi-copper enzyme maturation permease subunit
MFTQLFTIARNTLVEAVRQPIYLVLLGIGVVMLVLGPSLSMYSMEPGDGDNAMLLDMGLSSVFLTSVVLAALTATGVISREIETKTALTVVAKPVGRPVFVMGKFLGVAGAITLAFYVLSLVLLLTVRHRVMQNASDDLDLPVIGFGLGAVLLALGVATLGNYLYGWVFTSTLAAWATGLLTLAVAGVLVISPQWQVQGPLTEFTGEQARTGQLVIGLLLVLQAVWLLTAVAVAVSTRLGQVMTLVICLGVFALGLVSNAMSAWVDQQVLLLGGAGVWQSLGAIFAADLSIAQTIAYVAVKVVVLLAPNLQLLWPADAIGQGHSLIHDTAGELSLTYIGSVSAYAAVYTVGVLGLAVLLFQRREVG